MGASFNEPAPLSPMERLYDITFRHPLLIHSEAASASLIPVQADDQADIDISDDAFDFVRSIRVYHIQYRQNENRDGDCNRSDSTRLGSYGLQGDYRWTMSNVAQVPTASQLTVPNGCRSYFYRSVFVDWRDHAGNYSSEEVRY